MSIFRRDEHLYDVDVREVEISGYPAGERCRTHAVDISNKLKTRKRWDYYLNEQASEEIARGLESQFPGSTVSNVFLDERGNQVGVDRTTLNMQADISMPVVKLDGTEVPDFQLAVEGEVYVVPQH